MFAIITENDESLWDDQTGICYHFPSKYKSILQPKTQVIYYKGRIIDKAFEEHRLHNSPHYFGYAEIGAITEDVKSNKHDFYAEIINYVEFDIPVLAKKDGQYLEFIPESKKKNYWRDGVREINKKIFDSILLEANLTPEILKLKNNDLESYFEGSKEMVYTTKYERKAALRSETIAKKGTTCVCCGFNFEDVYGEIGKGYIQIHHTKPLHLSGGRFIENTVDDLEPVCPNCHAMVHRKKDKTLSIDELKNLIRSRK